jgi:hypothetical protein
MTIRSLADLGYVVRPELADPYTIPSGRRLRSLQQSTNAPTIAPDGDRIPVGNDLFMGPFYKVSHETLKPGKQLVQNARAAEVYNTLLSD